MEESRDKLMLKSKFGKSLVASVIIGASVLGYSAQHQEAKAVETNYYYDGIQRGSYQAYLKAKKLVTEVFQSNAIQMPHKII